MRRASWACCAIERLLLAALLWLAAGAAAAQGGFDGPLRHAELLTGVAPRVPVQVPPRFDDAGGAWEPVVLPLSRRERLPFETIASERLVLWFRFEVPAAQWPAAAVLTLARCSQCLAVSAYVDGELAATSQADPGYPHFNRPYWLPLGQPAAGPAVHRVVMRVDALRSSLALTEARLGPMAKRQPAHQLRLVLQQGVPAVASVAFLLLGLFSLAVGLRRPQSAEYRLFAAMAVLYWVRCWHYYLPLTTLPSPWNWLSEAATYASLLWMMWVAYRFSMQLHGGRWPRFDRWLLGCLMLLSALLGWAAVPPSPQGAEAWYGFWIGVALLLYPICLALAVLAAFKATQAARLHHSQEGLWVAAAVWLNIGLGVHDLLLMRRVIDLESLYLMPLGGLAMCVVFALIVGRRHLGALHAAEQASVQLAQRLAEREAELALSFEQVREAQRQQVLQEERQRLMREMHDGLGATLMSSLVAVQRGQLAPAEVADVLRDSVDELKIAIDSLDPAVSDVPVLLGTLRWRLGPRLQAAGLALDWQVSDLPPLPWLTPSDTLHLLRIVQELLANVVKHARANRVAVRTAADHEAVLLEIADDGVGFDPEAARPGGRGLRHLQDRAAALGATLELLSQPAAGTVARLRLPLQRAPAR